MTSLVIISDTGGLPGAERPEAALEYGVGLCSLLLYPLFTVGNLWGISKTEDACPDE